MKKILNEIKNIKVHFFNIIVFIILNSYPYKIIQKEVVPFYEYHFGRFTTFLIIRLESFETNNMFLFTLLSKSDNCLMLIPGLIIAYIEALLLSLVLIFITKRIVRNSIE